MPNAAKAFDSTFHTDEWSHPSTDWVIDKRQIRRSMSELDTSSLTYLAFTDAPNAIRRTLKSFIGSYDIVIDQLLLTANKTNPHKLFASAISRQMEEAIDESRAILDIPVDPVDGPAVQYTLQTWKRTIGLLRNLAGIFLESRGEHIPTPSIAPAGDGSLDLFWELPDLTLLINVPADTAKDATFFGRRLATSKMSGVIDGKDITPRHLTGWLSGAD